MLCCIVPPVFLQAPRTASLTAMKAASALALLGLVLLSAAEAHQHRTLEQEPSADEEPPVLQGMPGIPGPPHLDPAGVGLSARGVYRYVVCGAGGWATHLRLLC